MDIFFIVVMSPESEREMCSSKLHLALHTHLRAESGLGEVPLLKR